MEGERVRGSEERLKNYCWPLAVIREQLLNC